MRSVGEIVAGKYRVVRPIAEGGMGVLFEAVHIELEERVAIKFVRAKELGPEALPRFEREARLAVKLRTEHVARVLDAGRDEAGDPFIVMEYLEGVDLGHLLRDRGRVDVSLATDYLVQACHGLAEAHALTIVHRDVKPANLFLTEDAAGLPIIKVLDFGISKAVDSGGEELTSSPERAAQLLGTPHYVSPEQLLTPHEVDARADIWSLGVCAWAMVAGDLPFSQVDLVSLFARILNDQAPSIGAGRPLPAAFVKAIDRCLQRKRQDRFADVGQLAEALGPLTSLRIRPLVEHTKLLLERGRSRREQGSGPRSSLPSLGDTAGLPSVQPVSLVPSQPPSSSSSPPSPLPYSARQAPSAPPEEPRANQSGGTPVVVTHTLHVLTPLSGMPATYPPPPEQEAPRRGGAKLFAVVVVAAVAAAVLVVVGMRVLPRHASTTQALPPASASELPPAASSVALAAPLPAPSSSAQPPPEPTPSMGASTRPPAPPPSPSPPTRHGPRPSSPRGTPDGIPTQRGVTPPRE